MGFLYNKRQQVHHHQYDTVVGNSMNKKQIRCGKGFIQSLYSKQLRHRLSAENRSFLKSIGLKLRKNWA